MNVDLLEVLVTRQRQVSAELEAIKTLIQGYEVSIKVLYAEGQSFADEAKSISHKLKIELGLIEPAPQAS